ncbi:hypothetical protein E2562_008986 [Oryza meyeriana var. granulata]|uniref:Uncharacterized protein n=1 Tax=Oryza meyeriana var. granulata TaxID=110450 RepID=A0A6G1D1D3_9ORYZ|nr:hypothetical protein E2562_008986 [Oryza meyeriana var. granulata]
MGFIEKEEALDDTAIVAYVQDFDQPLPPHVIAGLRSLTRLDDKASILMDFTGQEGVKVAPA